MPGMVGDVKRKQEKKALHTAKGCRKRKNVTERTAKGLRKQLVEGLSNHLVRAADVSRLRCRSDFFRRRAFQRVRHGLVVAASVVVFV